MASISDAVEVQVLTQDLISSLHCDAEIRSIFERHVESGFLEHFINGELIRIASTPSYLVSSNVGQLDLNIINHPLFNYTARLVLPVANQGHFPRWQGDWQLIGVKGPGVARFRTLRVPPEADINIFERGVQLLVSREEIVHAGCFVENASPHEILDLIEVRSPVVLEMLTVKSNAEMHWRFDGDLISVFAEEAHVTTSRVRNLFDLAIKMRKVIPNEIYSAALNGRNTQLRLVAIQSLLLSDEENGFRELRRAIESDNTALSRGAQTLLDTLTSPRG